MTQPIRHRPRPPRQDGAALRYLDEWRRYVESIEKRTARGGSGRPRDYYDPTIVTGCPACDGELTDHPRERLAGLIANGGRRSHRLAAEVERLDRRYRDSTRPIPAPASAPWWKRRAPWR